MKSFASDNYAPVHPNVIEEIIKANVDHMKAYGADEITQKAIDMIKKTLNSPEAEVNFVFNGTGANVTGLQTVTNYWNSVIDRKSTRLNSSHSQQSRMPSSA